MGIRHALAGAVLGLVGSVLLALPAAAVDDDPYGPAPTPPGNLGTSTTNVGVGGVVVISGNGFAAGTTITINITVVNGFGRIQLDSAQAPMGTLLAAGTTRGASSVQGFAALTVNADASGAFTASVTLTQTGTNVITASGLDPNGNLRTLSTTVFVTGGSGGNGGNAGNGSGNGKGGALPNTGADLKLPLILGGALVLLGSGAIVAGRKRKQHTGAAA